MRTMFLSLILAAAASLATAAEVAVPSLRLDDHPLLAPLREVQAFDCSRTTCPHIRSCEEACYKLLVCGDTARDGDGDGIPCEDLCSRPCN